MGVKHTAVAITPVEKPGAKMQLVATSLDFGISHTIRLSSTRAVDWCAIYAGDSKKKCPKTVC
jgi:hypothetical protein